MVQVVRRAPQQLVLPAKSAMIMIIHRRPVQMYFISLKNHKTINSAQLMPPVVPHVTKISARVVIPRVDGCRRHPVPGVNAKVIIS